MARAGHGAAPLFAERERARVRVRDILCERERVCVYTLSGCVYTLSPSEPSPLSQADVERAGHGASAVPAAAAHAPPHRHVLAVQQGMRSFSQISLVSG